MVGFTAPLVALALLAGSAPVGAVQANPIRKVVSLLQKMQEKVIGEGEAEKKLFDAFQCQCKTSGGNLAASAAAATDKLPLLAATITKTEEQLTQTKEDLAQAQSDRASAKTAVAEAGEIRGKEAAAFAAEKAEYGANIGAIGNAVASLEKGLGGAFLQTTGARTVQKIAQESKKVFEDDRQKLLSFLGGAQEDAEETPGSGEITGILKQLGDEMAASLKDATAGENAAIAAYEALVVAKTKELAALQKAIEDKLKKIGDLSIAIAQMKNDLTDTEEALIADQKTLAGLDAACKTKAGEFEERTKTRGEELEALADTIKYLNSDDALELFKKTLPSASSSLLQVQQGAAAVRARAVAALRKGPRRVNLDLIALALRGKAAGFDKVIKLIDNMVAQLKTEQTDDSDKKEACEIQLDHADDSRKALERSQADEEKAIATANDDILNTRQEITALKKGLTALDKSVADATEQRQEENANYKDLIASDSAAKELIGVAKNRLQKFYNPKLATLAQVSAHVQNNVADSTNKEDSSGVLALIDALVRDLDKEITEAEADEKNAQADYETLTKNSAAKRAADAKSLTEKESAKAQLEEALESHTEAKGDATKELAATNEFIHALHLDCDFLLKYFDSRKEARASEVDALGNAKAVLSGADYSLVQTVAHRYLRHAQ